MSSNVDSVDLIASFHLSALKCRDLVARTPPKIDTDNRISNSSHGKSTTTKLTWSATPVREWKTSSNYNRTIRIGESANYRLVDGISLAAVSLPLAPLELLKQYHGLAVSSPTRCRQ